MGSNYLRGFKNFSAVGYFSEEDLPGTQVLPRSDRQRLGWVGLRSLIPHDRLNAARRSQAIYGPLAKKKPITIPRRNRKNTKNKNPDGPCKSRKPRRKENPTLRSQAISNLMTGQHRPANLYNGVLKPIIGYGIKGAIFGTKERAPACAKAYREVFPLMIETWRRDWNQGRFSFIGSNLSIS